MDRGVCPSVCPSVCRVPRPNSRTERPRKPKIGRMEACNTINLWTYLEVKMSKIKTTRPINAHTVNAQYIPKRKAYEIQTWSQTEYKLRRPASATSVVPFKVTWCVWQVLAGKSRTKRPRNTKIGRNVAYDYATNNNAYQFQGEKVKDQGYRHDYCWDRKCIISTDREGLRTSKLVRLWTMSRPAITTSEVGFLHASGDIPWRRPHHLLRSTVIGDLVKELTTATLSYTAYQPLTSRIVLQGVRLVRPIRTTWTSPYPTVQVPPTAVESYSLKIVTSQ